MDGIGKIGMSQDRDSVSVWRVCIPFDVDREVYIKNCFLTGTVCLTNENAEVQADVKIGKFALQLIDFPEDSTSQGSEVACATAPYSGQLYVIDVFYTASQYGAQKENQFHLYKTNGLGNAGILIDGNGNIILTVDGDEDNGVVTLNVTNQNRKGKLNIIVNGDVSIDTDGSTTIKSGGREITLDDAGINIDAGDENIFVGGGFEVLYSKTPGANSIVDISQIGVSKKVKVG